MTDQKTPDASSASLLSGGLGGFNEDTNMETVKLVKVLPIKIWAEKDMFGTVNIKLQHEGLAEFVFLQINYDYRYTDNAHQHELTQRILALLGADVPNVKVSG